MNTKQPDIAHLLRDVANEIRESATYPPLHTWEDGHAMDARAAHDEYLAAAEAVEALIAENETLHAENETLRAGLDAARLEIESLQAQLEAVGAGGVSAQMGASQSRTVGAEPVACTSMAEIQRMARGELGAMATVFPPGTAGFNVLLYAAPQPAAQALDSVRVFWQQHTQADALSMTMAELHDDVELVIRATSPQPAAQAQDARQPLTEDQIGAAVRAAHIAFCLDKFQTFERALVHFTEQAHGIAAQQGEKT